MEKNDDIGNTIRSLSGKTIAIVYTFENDTPKGLEHFYTWKSDIIIKWMMAIQNLSCMPLILDVRTFVDKAMNKTLPFIDYVINLNTGTYDLSVMALIPSVCSAINIPCIPCNAMTITAGENKKISNLIAKSVGLNVPKDITTQNIKGIFRPINLGNSLGVKKEKPKLYEEGIYQEFIEGYEMTTPVVYNPIKKEMDILPSVIFYPKNDDAYWYYNSNDKSNQKGYDFRLAELDENIKQKYIELVQNLNITTFCRIDARIKSPIISKKNKYYFKMEDTFFIEINVMPTIRSNNSFSFSFESIEFTSSFYKFKKQLTNNNNECDINTFLLACSMLSFQKNN